MKKQVKKILKGILLFDPDDGLYKDHFPGKPIVPGSLIIHGFTEVLKKSGIKSKISGFKNFRFKKFLSPGEYPYIIKIEPKKIICEIFNENERVVTGTFKICG